MPESKLAAQLKAGERVFIRRNARQFFDAIVSVFGLVFIFSCIFLLPSASPDKIGKYAAIPAMLVFFSFAVYAWSQLLHSAIQFTPTELMYWNWRGQPRQIPLADIVAANTHLSGRPAGLVIYICCLTPGQSGGACWLKLFAGKIDIAQIVLEVIALRIKLIESPSENEYRRTWQKPGHEYDIPPMKWWMRM